MTKMEWEPTQGGQSQLIQRSLRQGLELISQAVSEVEWLESARAQIAEYATNLEERYARVFNALVERVGQDEAWRISEGSVSRVGESPERDHSEIPVRSSDPQS